jgi:integrase
MKSRGIMQWPDVDLEHGIVHIHRSRGARRGDGIKPTKSAAARPVPIEPALLPMLKAMHDESEGQSRVMRLPGDGGPRKLRMYLTRARLNRADLFITDATRKAMTFHDLAKCFRTCQKKPRPIVPGIDVRACDREQDGRGARWSRGT